jgi:hypothetical protein
MRDILSLLGRTDKWYAGGAGRLLYAPPFPSFQETPGFWDTAHYYNYEIPRLFTWTLLDEDGMEIPLRLLSSRWTPSRIIRIYGTRRGTVPLSVTETRAVLPTGVALARLAIGHRGRGTRRIRIVAWSAFENSPAPGRTSIADPVMTGGIFGSLLHAAPAGSPPIAIGSAMGIDRKIRSYAVQLSEGSAARPVWSLSPMREKFREGKLPSTIRTSGVTDEGILFAALHADAAPGGGKVELVTIAFAAAPSADEARANLCTTLREPEPFLRNDRDWKGYFAGVPNFSCSDPFIERSYWYRWYGLRLNTLPGGEGQYRHPVVCEGIGYFRAPISYSAPCHMLENRWRGDPELARGSLRTFLDNRRDDGGFRGYIDLAYYRQEMFYHARWGRALAALHAVHPSPSFLREASEGLAAYARYFDRERDAEGTGLYDIDNHYETGQEYMHRYTAVNPGADRDNWGEVFRLKGVDVTVYIYELKRALAAAARELGSPEDADGWDEGADRIRDAVRRQMWDPGAQMFFDVDPATGKRTGVKAATCFYPYMTDIAGVEHRAGLTHHLLNRAEFWSRFPVPSSSMDDPLFSDEPEWKGKRMHCPWNGRVWPMTNSHIADALAFTALASGDRTLRRTTAAFIRTYLTMMFFDGDPGRPNSFEHYNPVTGIPSVYRGVDDYQHSWVVDLILSYVCGIRPEPEAVVIDPFPFGLARAAVDGVVIRGRRFRVAVVGKRFTVWVDGKKRASHPLGTPARIDMKE